MKYIKLFEDFTKHNYQLYHGSPFKFDKFNKDIIYFSDNYDFAQGYADSKADIVESDYIYVYKCDIEANFFDIDKKSDYELLYNNLPLICNITDRRTWFDGDIPKDKLIELLKNTNPIKKVHHNWNYYENDIVENIIKNNGYDGYIAIERYEKTYALFNLECIKSCIEV